MARPSQWQCLHQASARLYEGVDRRDSLSDGSVLLIKRLFIGGALRELLSPCHRVPPAQASALSRL